MIEFDSWLLSFSLTLKSSEDLILKLKEYSILCNFLYRKGNPIISDFLFDQISDFLSSKGVIVNYLEEFNTSSFLKKRKQDLPVEMMSLDKEKSIEGLYKWLQSKGLDSNSTELVITPKYDGISLLVNNYTAKAWTRGNGKQGEESSLHFALMKQKTLGFEGPSYSIGEAIISKKNWEKYFKGQINPRSKTEYKGSRNTVAGLLGVETNVLEVKELSYVDFIRYETDDKSVKKSQRLWSLNEHLNKVSVPFRLTKLSLLTEESLFQLYLGWSDKYQIDGLVFHINETGIESKLGSESNGNPAYARAYKHPLFSLSKQTTILNLTRKISKQGFCKPVLNIEEIELGGAIVKGVTGINMDYVLSWKLFPGTKVLVSRSGDVIPKILEVEGIKIPFRHEFTQESLYKQAYQEALLLRQESFDRSENQNLNFDHTLCPSCNSTLSWDKNHIELVCQNKLCYERQISQLVSFFETLDVEEFGEPSITKLYNSGFDTFQKILNISKDQLMSIEGFGESMTEKLLTQFSKLKTEGVSFSLLGSALGFFQNLGEKTLQMIVDSLPEFERTLYAPIQELLLIKGVSQITAESFERGVKQMLEEGFGWPVKVSYFQTPKLQITESFLSGKEFCFTKFRDKFLEDKIKRLGGIVSDDVKKTTTHLIIKDKSLSSSKVQKAQKLNIPIWDSLDLINFLNSIQ